MAVLALDYCRSCWPLPVFGSDKRDYRRQADFEVKADMTFHYVAFDVAFGVKRT
jgi:hypothetical protein